LQKNNPTESIIKMFNFFLYLFLLSIAKTISGLFCNKKVVLIENICIIIINNIIININNYYIIDYYYTYIFYYN